MLNNNRTAHNISFHLLFQHVLVASWLCLTCFYISAQPADTTQVIAFEQDRSIINPFTPASFPGGMENFYRYVINTIRMPRDAMGINGKVYVEFVIDSTGQVLPEEVRVLKSLSKSCDKEAVRIMRGSPPWLPAREGDKPVRQKMVLPIGFLSMR